jgi:hypothetical protein
MATEPIVVRCAFQIFESYVTDEAVSIEISNIRAPKHDSAIANRVVKAIDILSLLIVLLTKYNTMMARIGSIVEIRVAATMLI